MSLDAASDPMSGYVESTGPDKVRSGLPAFRPSSGLPARYSPLVAGYARGPFLNPRIVTPTSFRWRNARTYLIENADDGLNYRAVRVTVGRDHYGWWAIELLGTMLPAAEFDLPDLDV